MKWSALKVLFGWAVSWLLLVADSAGAEDGAGLSAKAVWPDTPAVRVEALALLQTLNAALLSNDSATLTLDRWCESHKMAAPAKIVAERVHDTDREPTAEVRQLLGVGPTEQVRYRHVRLHCGAHVFSEADNWYLPAHLTPEMNKVLDTSDTPFGRAVQELHFHRRTLSARLLWSPLPEGWEMANSLPRSGKRVLELPPEVIQHRAVLSLPDGTPFSALVETYTGGVLDFPAPPQP
jgi:chorismate-pyruvate lyase